MSVSVYAQDDSATQAAGINFSVDSEFSYDDNILRQRQNPVSSRLWVLNPQLNLIKESARDIYSVTYDAKHNNYLDSPTDTFTSQRLAGKVEKSLNDSNTVTLDGSYDSNYEQRGTGFSAGQDALSIGSPTPLIVREVVATYQLGADEAKMRLIANAGRRMTDRDSALIANDSRDYNESMKGAQVLYRVGSRTDLAVEYRGRDIDYPRNPVDSAGREAALDGTEKQYLVGFDLEATAKTTGKLRVGTLKREFRWKEVQWDSAAPAQEAEAAQTPIAATAAAPVTSGSDLYWEFAAVWSPRTYSRFELSTRTSTQEALGVGSYIRSKDVTLSWTHNWRASIQSKFDFSSGTDTYKDSTRVDSRKIASVRLQYDVEQWLNFGFGYRYQNLDSNFANVAFDKSVYYIFANYRNNRGK
jgi:hypothetical protein